MESISSTDERGSAWWEMQCDQNHTWWRLLPTGSEPAADDLRCPIDEGSAITAGRRALADRLMIRLIPATWEHERVIGFEGQFFIEISDISGGRSLQSGRSFEFHEACRRLAWFAGLGWTEAERRWNRVGMQKVDPLKRMSQGESTV